MAGMVFEPEDVSSVRARAFDALCVPLCQYDIEHCVSACGRLLAEIVSLVYLRTLNAYAAPAEAMLEVVLALCSSKAALVAC